MMCAEEPVRSNPFQIPVYETGGLTANEIQELLSLFDSTDPVSTNNSGSDGSSRAVYSPDERKQRRKVSNRESARRSRWRRKRHLENLSGEVNRLGVENRELKNRLGFVSNQCRALWRENERLVLESVALTGRLSNLCSVLSAMESRKSNAIKLNNNQI